MADISENRKKVSQVDDFWSQVDDFWSQVDDREKSNVKRTSANKEYLAVDEVVNLLNISKQAIHKKCDQGEYKYIINEDDGRRPKMILLSSLPPQAQEKYLMGKPVGGEGCGQDQPSFSSILDCKKYPVETTGSAKAHMIAGVPVVPTSGPGSFFQQEQELSAMTHSPIPPRQKELALARYDLVREWQQYRANNGTDKKISDNQFFNMYNSGMYLPHLYERLGQVTLKTVYRWQSELKAANDNYMALAPAYKYSATYGTQRNLSQAEQKLFMYFLLQPNKMAISTAYNYTVTTLQNRGQQACASYQTYYRYARDFQRTHHDTWILAREGEKALKDKIIPYIQRDASVLEVGDCLVADGHTLDFRVINPFTGKPCRATLVGFLDWKSKALAGYEIMITENTQCISSALRNAILNLGKIPRCVYLDNGKAFKGKYFTGCEDFQESGFRGVYASLGIHTVFATKYNARAKVIERSFKDFTSMFAKLIPSYVGNTMTEKPAYMKPKERIHKILHKEIVPTIAEVKRLIDYWLSEYYYKRNCPNVQGMTIAEVWQEGRGPGVDSSKLDDLLLSAAVKTVRRGYIRFLGANYEAEELVGLDDSVVVKYSLFDLSQLQIYTHKGEYICTATTVMSCHPLAELMGDAVDLENMKQATKQQRRLTRAAENRYIKTKKKVDTELFKIDWSEVPIIEDKPAEPVIELLTCAEPLEKKSEKTLYLWEFEKEEAEKKEKMK